MSPIVGVDAGGRRKGGAHGVVWPLPLSSAPYPDVVPARQPKPERDWEPPLVNLCNPEPPEPCDCGYVGLWDVRPWFEWYDAPPPTRKERREAKGRVSEGWWVIGGLDERCPGCGDIERFDHSSNLIETTSEQAHVILLDVHRARP